MTEEFNTVEAQDTGRLQKSVRLLKSERRAVKNEFRFYLETTASV